MTDPSVETVLPDAGTRRNPLLGWFADRRINTKILTAVAVVAVMGGGISAVALNRMSELNDDISQIKEANVQRLSHLGDARGRMADMFNINIGVVAIPDPALKAQAVENLHKATDDVTTAFEAYKSQPSSSKDWQENVAAFEEGWEKYIVLRGVVLLGEKPPAGVDIPTDTAGILKQFNDVAGAINTAMDNLAATERQEAAAVTAAATEEYESARTQILMLLAAGLLLALGLALTVSRLIVRPLAGVSGVLDAMAKGDLTQKVQVASRDEVGAMAVAVNQATDSVRQAIEALASSADTLATSSDELSGVSRQIAASADEASIQA
ncbi:HAMP domain-containing protein, partial [Planobispora rosea]